LKGGNELVKPKLILIEGLPGAGKTTSAQIVNDILGESEMKAHLFLEGNVDHPADFEGVAYFTTEEFANLLSKHEGEQDFLQEHAMNEGEGFFFPYQKIRQKIKVESAEKEALLNEISSNDLYELPFDQHMKHVLKRWKGFAERAKEEDHTYIFESCFIQNPLTIGMIKYGEDKEKVRNYVLQLADEIKELGPLLLYIEQDDLSFSFKKAINERSREWSEGFIHYYTTQGYGLENGLVGVEGTIDVLEARRKAEKEVMNQLLISKETLNNSMYNINESKRLLTDLLKKYYL
jgi:hypothetical protein